MKRTPLVIILAIKVSASLDKEIKDFLRRYYVLCEDMDQEMERSVASFLILDVDICSTHD